MFLLAGSLIGLIVVTPIQNHFDPDSGWGNLTEGFSQYRFEADKSGKGDKETNSSYLWAYLVFTYVYTALIIDTLRDLRRLNQIVLIYQQRTLSQSITFSKGRNSPLSGVDFSQNGTACTNSFA